VKIKPQQIKLGMAGTNEANREGRTTKHRRTRIEVMGILASSSAQLQHLH